MSSNEIKKDMKRNDIKDNPFDVMLYHSLELTRNLLFACQRMRNDRYPEALQPNLASIDKRIDFIEKEFYKLMKVSDDTISICRETSYYHSDDKLTELNEILLKYERVMETVWTRDNPNRNDEYEKIRLGEQSLQYKRLLELRKIADELNKDSDYWCFCIDVIQNKEECIENGWMDEKEYKEKEELIEKYHLSRKDINYMRAYKFKE